MALNIEEADGCSRRPSRASAPVTSRNRPTASSQLSSLEVIDAQTPKLNQLTQPYAAGKVAPKPMRAGIAGHPWTMAELLARA